MAINFNVFTNGSQPVPTSLVLFVLGIVLFLIGTGWLLYLTIKSKSVYESDQDSFANRVVYSSSIAVVGILLCAFGGIFVATAR
jgi:predicted acyltransferase